MRLNSFLCSLLCCTWEEKNIQAEMPLPTSSADDSHPNQRRYAIDEYLDRINGTDPLSLAMEETRFHVLERFSRVTQYAAGLLASPNAAALLPLIPASLRPTLRNARLAHADSDAIVDYEPARVYLAKWHHELQLQRSREWVAEAGNLKNEPIAIEASFSIVEDAEALASATISASGRLAFLKEDSNASAASHAKPRLGVWDETVLADTGIGSFVVLSTDTTPPPPRVSRQLPLSLAEWKLYFDEYVPVPSSSLARPSRLTIDMSHSIIHVSEEDTDVSPLHDEYELTGDGKLVAAFSEIQRRIFAGGVEPNVRPQVWRFLFGLYPWDSTHAERRRIKAAKTRDYWRMKDEWLEVAERLGKFDTEEKGEVGKDLAADMYKDAATRVDKDVPRTDRNHSFYNDPNPSTPRAAGVGPFSPHQNLLRDILITYACSYSGSDRIGYVQGMSDLLSPFLITTGGDEADAFWLFAHFMDTKKINFLEDGSGMRAQLDTMRRLLQATDPTLHAHLTRMDALNLFCCFRWFLVAFKREFNTADTCLLWEVVETRWAAGGADFLYFVALAILDEHRDAILRCLLTFDELLKYVNDLSQTLPVNATLEAAELLFLRFRVRAASLGALPSLAPAAAGGGLSSEGTRMRGTASSNSKSKKGKSKKDAFRKHTNPAEGIGLLEVLNRMESAGALSSDVKGNKGMNSP